jgi:hypothetical protein
MGSDLRTGVGATRLQRILMMRLLRVVSAGGLALFALLAWMAVGPSAQRGHDADEAIAVVRDGSPELGSVGADDRLPTSPTARQSARVAVRHQLLARVRAGEGGGETTLTSALAASLAPLFGDVSASARAELRRLAQRHATSGETSPFDATAPPTSSQRNG